MGVTFNTFSISHDEDMYFSFDSYLLIFFFKFLKTVIFKGSKSGLKDCERIVMDIMAYGKGNGHNFIYTIQSKSILQVVSKGRLHCILTHTQTYIHHRDIFEPRFPNVK